MIFMKKYLLLVFAVSFSGIASNAQNAQSEVMMKMLSLKNALIAKDSVALSNLLADEVTYGHSTGVIQTKAQLIRSALNGEQDYRSIEPSNMNIRIYNDNTAVVTINLKVNVINSGKPLDVNLAATLVWVKTNGDWKLVARQAVKLPA
jgi:ketosteroid isomerase-like protein